MRSNWADSRVSPNVVSESAAIATSLCLRTTTSVVMGDGKSGDAAPPRRARRAVPDRSNRARELYRVCRSPRDRQHDDRRQRSRRPRASRPLPELSDGCRCSGRQCLRKEIPCPHERGQRIRVVQRWSAGLLRQLLAAGEDRDRVMQIRWRWQPELALQPNLAGRRREQISAAHDMRDRLRGVVDDDRELIGKDSVGALDDEITDVAVQALLLPTLQAVMKTDRLAGNQEPSRAAFAARRDTAAAGAGIPAFSAGAERHGFELPARAGASEDPAARGQAVERYLIQRGALALPKDLPVPLETVRSQRREHPIGDAVAAARRVDIFDPQQPLAAG